MFAVVVSIPFVLLPVFSVPAQTDCGVQPVTPTAVEAPILNAFSQRIEAYMQVHNDVERKLSLQSSLDGDEDVFAAVGQCNPVSAWRVQMPGAARF